MTRPAFTPARPAQFDRAAQHRRAMLAKINIARHQLGMVEDDYRQLLFSETGKISLKACDDRQLDKMLAAMKRKGFRPLAKGSSGKKGTAQHPVALKARALWISLYHLGVVHNPAEEALEVFAKKQTGCERMIWMSQSQGFKLIEALKAMATRHGWVQHCRATNKPRTPAGLQISLCQTILAKLKEAGGAREDMDLNGAVEQFLGIGPDQAVTFPADLYARLADALGKELRAVAPGMVQR